MLALTGVIVVLPAASAYAQAPAPANDAFAAPLELTSASSPLTGSTVGATAEPGEPSWLSGRARHSVWFTFTAHDDRRVTIDSCGSGFDTELTVYAGESLDALGYVAADDDSCGLGSRVTFDAAPGTTYRIALDGYRGEAGDYTLRLDQPLANDDAANPRVIADGEPATGDTSAATAAPGEPDHAGAPAAHSVWFSAHADPGAAVVVETCGSAFATRLSVYGAGNAAVAESAQQSCGDGRLGNAVRFTAAGDGTYEIALDGVDDAAGAYRIAVTTSDDRAHPYWLSQAERLTVSNAGATHEPGEPAHAGDPGGGSLWFGLGMAASGRTVVVETCGTRFGGLDTVLAAYADETLLAANDDTIGCGDGGTGSRISFVPPPGADVRIAVDGKGGAAGEFTIFAAAAPVNDDRAHAAVLPQSPVGWDGDTTLATAETGEPDHGGAPAAHSVWYRWHAQITGPVDLAACGDGFAGAVGVSTTDLQPVSGAAAGPGCSADEPGVRFTATAGTDYLIAVDGGEGRFALTLATPPANDDVAHAQDFDGWIGSTTNRGASAEPGEPAHAGIPATRSVWYRYVAPEGVTGFTISVCPEAPIVSFMRAGSSPQAHAPLQLAVYRGTTVSDLVPVGSAARITDCGDVTVPLDPQDGRSFLIAVDGNEGTGFELSSGTSAPPENDDRAHAETLTWDTSGWTEGATHEPGEPDHAGAGGSSSVWYRWQPSASGPAQVDVCDPRYDVGLDTVVAVYTLDGDTLVPAGHRAGTPGCDDARQIAIDVTAGDTYWVAVDTRPGGDPGFRLRAIMRPANDDVAHAERLTGDSYPGAPIDLATVEDGEPEHAGVAGAPSVWYRWTPGARGPVTLDTCTGDAKVDSILAVYTSGADGLEPVAASDDAPGCGNADKGARVTFEPQDGVEYLIAVAAHPGRTGQVTLSLPPANDLLLGAFMETGESFSAWDDTSRAGAEPGEPAHGGAPASHSLWYTWVPSRSATATVETCGSGARLGVYFGSSVDALTPVTSTASDCASGDGQRLRFDVQKGVAYRIAVDSDSGYASLWAHLAPANDRLAGATYLGSLSGFSLGGDTGEAGREPGEPDHAGAGGTASLWYSFTSWYSGNAHVDTCTGAGFDTALAVYTQDGTGMSGLVPAGAADDSAGCGDGTGSRVHFKVSEGVRYYIAVDGHGGAKGSFQLQFAMAPQNDSFASAYEISPGQTGGTLDDAGREPGEPDDGYPDAPATVWYSWTAPHGATAHIDVCPSEGDAGGEAVTVYRQDGPAFGDLARVGDTVDASCGAGRRVRWRAEADTRYRFVVTGAEGGDFSLDLVDGPGNDDFAHAAELTAGTTRTSTFEATSEPGEPAHGAAGGASVWYRYTATRTGPLVISTCGSDFDTLLAVYDDAASLGALHRLAADDDGERCGTGNSRLSVDLVAGKTYLIAADGKAGAAGSLSLSVDPPANDRRADAATLTGRPAFGASTTLGATAEQDEPGGVTQGSVWWRWTAPETRTVKVTDCGSTAPYQTELAIYAEGDAEDQASIQYVCDGGFAYTLDATQGTTYFLQVYGREGDVQLHIDAPENDDQGRATQLTLGDDATVDTDGSLAGAGSELGEDSHGGAAPTRSVWFSWTAPVGAPVEVSTCGSATATVLQPYVSDYYWWNYQPQSATVTPCAGGQRETFTAESGREYQFAVAAAGPDAGAFHLHIDQSQDVTPPHTQFSSGPGQLTNAPAPTLYFSASEPSTFECSVDGADATACTSPLQLPGLGEGDHQVSVRATDHAGNRETQPATYAFRIDRTPPQTTLTGAVNGGPVHSLPPWQVTADGPVDRFECAIDGNSVGCGSIFIGSLGLGMHQLSARAVDRAGNADPTPATDTFQLVDEAPTAALTLDNGSGPASLEVALGISATDPEDDPLYYTVDWGDGKSGQSGGLPASPAGHIYTQAGVYTISVTVSDPWRSTVATKTVEVAPGEPLDARAGDDIVAMQDEDITFDGSDSRPLKGIERYDWSFGDGTPAEHGARVTHAYTAGTYTARLDVTLDGKTRSDEVSVTVKPPEPGGLVMHLTNNGAPLSGVDLQIVDADGARHSAVSDNRGEARLRGLPDGAYTIFADHAGFRPATAQVALAGGDGEATIALTPGEVAVAQLTSHPLTQQEAIAAGVDPEAASSYTSYSFTANIVLVGDDDSGPVTVPISGTINNGSFYGGSIGGSACGRAACAGVPPGAGGGGKSIVTTGAVVDGRPILATMVVPLDGGSFMKEFFDVSMTISNLAPDGFTLSGGRTALELPSGLSLAATANGQSASVAMADIPGGASKTMSWTVQGDAAGEYPLAASYTGTLDPSGRAVTIRAQTSDPLKVWGATAVQPVVEVDGIAGADHPFKMRVGVKNTATVPVYNSTIDLRTEGSAHYLEQPEQQDHFTFASVPPGQTQWSDTIVLIPDTTGDVDVSRSVVRKVAGDSSTDTQITTQPRDLPFDEDPDLEATPRKDSIELDWDPVPGAKGYRIYRTSTDRETPFPATPITSSASSKATIQVPHTDPTQLYAVSAIVNGRPTLRSPVVEAKSADKDPDDDDDDDDDDGNSGHEDPNGPPESTCEKDDSTHTSSLKIGSWVTVYTGCFTEVAPGVWEGEVGAIGRVRAAGIDVTPTANAKVRIDIPKTTLSVQDATVEVGRWVLYHGSVSWDFTKPVKVELPEDAKFKGLPVTGSIEADFDLEHVDLTATAGLPKNFGGVTGTLKLGATEKDGLVLGEVSINVKQAPLGKLGLKDIDLKYSKVDGADRWAGSAGVMLPAKGFAESISGSISWLDGSFESASVAFQGLNKPLGETGIFLQRIQLSITLQPDLEVGGGLGVSAGPRIAGKEALSVDGEARLSFGDPITYDLSGKLTVVDEEMASGHLKYAMPDAVDVDGSADFEKEILGATLGVKAELSGWVVGTQAFNIEGSGEIRGPGFSEGGEAVLSSVGIAACRHGWGPDFGAGYRWDGSGQWFASSCGLGDFEATRSARGAKAQAQARGLQVAAGTREVVFAVTGDTTAPKVTVTGPAGETVATPAGAEAVSTPRFFLMQNPGDRTTYVAVEAPSAGAWDIRTQPGSAAIKDIRQATSLPPVDVQGEVHGNALSWTLAQIPGQEVTFVAEGAGTRQVIGTTSDASGTFAFTPDPGPGGRRVVRAYVTQDGLPRETVDVATFDVADPVLAPPTGLKLERLVDDVTGSWAASPDANGYRATVDVGDGRRLSFDLGADERSVLVPGVAEGDTVTLEVAARLSTGSFGPSAVTQLDGSGAPPTVTIAKPADIASGDSVDLHASAPAGVTLAWELDGDGLYDDASGDTATTQHFDHPGRYAVGVRATDTAGRVALATETVTVHGRAPLAGVAAGSPSPLTGETASFTGSDSDPDGTVLTRDWDLDDDGQFDDAQGATASTVFATAGRHTVRYRVVDDSGQATTAEQAVDVAANRAPELAIALAPAAPAEGETVRLTATARDPEDRGLEAVAWDLDGDGRFTDGTGLAVEHEFPAGTTTVRARVADSGGAVTTVERAVSVAGQAQTPPPPAATPAPTPPATVNPAHPRALGGLTAPKSVRRAALLKSGVSATFRDLLAGARLDVTLRFVPSHGRAVTLAHVHTTARKAGRLVRKLSVTRAGRRALRPGARGRLEVVAVARSGTEPAVKLTRRISYRP